MQQQKNTALTCYTKITIRKKEQNHISTGRENTQERRVHKTNENDNLLFHNKVNKVVNNKSIKKILNHYKNSEMRITVLKNDIKNLKNTKKSKMKIF